MVLDRHRVGGNGPGLGKEEAEKLLNHVRAIENINGEIKDLQEDRTDRKALAKADGFDTNIIDAVIKRRAAGEGQVALADQLVWAYEEALAEQKRLADLDEQSEAASEWRRREAEQLERTLAEQRREIRGGFDDSNNAEQGGGYVGPL